MSSHREAPEISKDPVADSTDTYAFVSPDRPGTVTLITNYIPLEDPAGGPNFFEFGDDVLYVINVDHTGDGNRGRGSRSYPPANPPPPGTRDYPRRVERRNRMIRRQRLAQLVLGRPVAHTSPPAVMRAPRHRSARARTEV